MTRPQIVVNVGAALQRRGAPTDTGVAFMVYAGATGQTVPVECSTTADITGTLAPAVVQDYISRALAQGAPKVYALRAEVAVPATPTEAEWKTALAKLTDEYGPGQVLIPGVFASAAHAALLDHATKSGRFVLLDTDKGALAPAIVASATALNASPAAGSAMFLAGWAKFEVTPGVFVEIPPSVVTAGLIARGDVATGHANNAAAGDQGRGAGFVLGAVDLHRRFTDAEHDTLHAAGVSVFRVKTGQPQLYGFVSLSLDPVYRQANHGRMAMQLRHGLAARAEQFLFRQIDDRGHLFSQLEGMLRGYLAPLHSAGALYGATADDAYDVDVQNVNTPATIAAGDLRSAVAVALSNHTEKVTIDVVLATAEGADQ